MVTENEKLIDVLDVATQEAERDRELRVAEIRRRAAAIPDGEPGDCNYCGLYFTRIVDGHCGRCRDLLGRP